MESILSFVETYWLQIIAGLINFLWVYLEYRASIWLWPVGIVLPIFYIAVSWEALFLGNILVNVYYLITSIIGWVMWLRRRKGQEIQTDEGVQTITHVGGKEALIHLSILVLLFYPIYTLLEHNSSLPVADALATLFSFLGMVYLSRKQLEHWFCWIIANSLSIWVFSVAGDKVSACVFAVNLIVSIMGYRHWRGQMSSVATQTQDKHQ